MNLQRRHRNLHRAILGAIAATSLCLIGTATIAGGEISAAQLLPAAGRDQGLCVIIGCGDESDPGLAAVLARPGKLLVHGIALDDACLARAQKAIAAAAVDGLASVERLPLRPLPYRDNMANLIVVLNPQRAIAAGFSSGEALRVVSPLGRVLIDKGGQWETVVKPMPKIMDQWTHETHGPDGNTVSSDKCIHFPFGFRWNAGLSMNLKNPNRSGNTHASTRGIALCEGRCFTLSQSVLENLGPTYNSEQGLDQYVTARDAFNGLLLWRTKIGATYYGGLIYANRAPFVAVGQRVYVTGEDGTLLALDAATGAVARKFPTVYAPGRLLVDRNVVVTADWKEGTRLGGLDGVDRRFMDFPIREGAVEAFDAQSGSRLWMIDKLATSIVSADGILFMIQREGADRHEELRYPHNQSKEEKVAALAHLPPRPEQRVTAVELASGKVLWQTRLVSPEARESLRLETACMGVITVSHNYGAKTSILSAIDGRVVATLTPKSSSCGVFYQGAFHLGGKKYSPASGREIGDSDIWLVAKQCSPHYFVNDMVVEGRHCVYNVEGERLTYGGARGACLFGSIPAFGAFYAAQNWCACAPGEIGGFSSYGPIAHEPTATEMERAVLAEPGSAAAAAGKANPPKASTSDWPMYRHDSLRSNATTAAAPQKLDVLWRKSLTPPAADGPIGADWKEALRDPLTAPVVAEGTVVAAATDRNQVIALDAATGSELWRQTVGSRVDSSPTIYQGLCLFGSHDGYLYALSRADGGLAWRLRVAPLEDRMVSYGKVESPWPVVGTVLTANGLVYASAGRSQASDGGIVVRAVDPSSGKIAWSKAIVSLLDTPEGQDLRKGEQALVLHEFRKNDLMLDTGEAIQLMLTRMNPKTGAIVPNATREFKNKAKQAARASQSKQAKAGGKGKPAAVPAKPVAPEEVVPGIGLEGFTSGIWTRLGDRKYIAMTFGSLSGSLISWGDKVVGVNAHNGDVISAVRRDKVTPIGKAIDPQGELSKTALPNDYQATAVVVCRNAIVAGGGVYKPGAKQGKGFVLLLALADGKPTTECRFDVPLAYNGIAVTEGKIYATLADGSIVCLGAP